MKKLIFIGLIAIFALGCKSSSGDKGSSSSNNKYELKSGIITYKTTMTGMPGTTGMEMKVIQYFKDYGESEAIVTQGEMMGQKLDQCTLRKEGYSYVFSKGQKDGQKVKLDSAATAADKMDEAAILKKGGKKVGTEKVLDKECVVYEMTENGNKAKVWIWKNMMLKMVSSQNQMEVKMEATEVKETSDFPAGTFDIPKDVNFKEGAQGMKDFENPNAKG